MMPVGLIVFIIAIPLSILLIWHIDRTCAEAEFGKDRQPKNRNAEWAFDYDRAVRDNLDSRKEPAELPDVIDDMLEAAGVKRKEKEYE